MCTELDFTWTYKISEIVYLLFVAILHSIDCFNRIHKSYFPFQSNDLKIVEKAYYGNNWPKHVLRVFKLTCYHVSDFFLRGGGWVGRVCMPYIYIKNSKIIKFTLWLMMESFLTTYARINVTNRESYLII